MSTPSFLLRFTVLNPLLVAALGFGHRPLTGTEWAKGDPLPSWKGGPAKEAVIDFVTQVTREGGKTSFRPPKASPRHAPLRRADGRKYSRSLSSGLLLSRRRQLAGVGIVADSGAFSFRLPGGSKRFRLTS